MAKLDGLEDGFDIAMPPRDLNERLETYKKTASLNFSKFENNTDQLIDIMVAKQSQLSKKLSEQQWTQKLMQKINNRR